MKKYGVTFSTLTNNVYVGKVNKKRTEWLEKEEVPKAHALELAFDILKSYLDKGDNNIIWKNSKEEIEFTVISKNNKNESNGTKS